jgi:Fe2+ transport system protein FeoA
MVLNTSQNTAGGVQTASTTLDRLPVGQPAIVSDVAGDGPELVRLRIMGLCVGAGVHTLRAGSRMIVCAGGTRIGLTSEVAAAVSVRPVDETPPCRV